MLLAALDSLHQKEHWLFPTDPATDQEKGQEAMWNTPRSATLSLGPPPAKQKKLGQPHDCDRHAKAYPGRFVPTVRKLSQMGLLFSRGLPVTLCLNATNVQATDGNLGRSSVAEIRI